jgi:ATP-binding cassette subfamily B protein
VVLDRGKIAEIGRHDDLIKKKGSYYNLVKNQLELGT